MHIKMEILPGLQLKIILNRENLENRPISSSTPGGTSTVTFNKAKLVSRTSTVNTKLKRKLATAMTRSNTVNTLIPLNNSSDNLNDESPVCSNKQTNAKAPVVTNEKSVMNEESTNFFNSLTSSISNEFLTSPIKKIFVKDKTVKPSSEKETIDRPTATTVHKPIRNLASLNIKFENKPNSCKI
jgi:hypothetical protein